ncbi:MAG TPA: amino acid permease [Candidatus Polarisedimenticolia bacterium]|nr:amino acid permease [Candidatus Polarisedimenticolia bacterium]
MASASRYGAASLTLWLLAFAAFFVPQGLAVTELSTRYPQEGGIYVWTKKAFGDFHGFVCGWCYWTNNLLYFPGLLAFTVGNAVYIGGTRIQALGDNKVFVTSLSLLFFWFVILINIRGLKAGKWLQNLGAVGTWVPALVLVLMGVSAYYMFGSANPFSWRGLKPEGSFDTLNYWSQMCFAFAGLELASIMGGEIRDPRRNVPRGIVIGGILVALIYISGSLSIYVAVPAKEVSVVHGVMQAIAEVTSRVGVVWIMSILAFLLMVSGLGGTSAWVAGSARIPFVVGLDRYLPSTFGKVHPKYGSPYVSILAQGIISSLFIATGYIGGSVEEAYLTLVNITVIIYFVPYLYLFAATLVLRAREGLPSEVIPIPGGKAAAWFWCGLGFVTTVTAIAVALIPPQEATNALLSVLKIVGGCLLIFASGGYLYLRARRASA